ncbi:MAG TPA: hypothetical protein VN081_05065 [Dongiaceae bacterium]|nr:hypothetical protein [Dongiaceae bacterium]
MSKTTKQIVQETIDSASDNSFNGVYDHDVESEWLASKLNTPVKKDETTVDSDPPMFQSSIQRFPENG